MPIVMPEGPVTFPGQLRIMSAYLVGENTTAITTAIVEAIAPSIVDTNVPIAASTYYTFVTTISQIAKLTSGTLRTASAGQGPQTKLDILKVPSGLSPSSGTPIISEVSCNNLIPNTNYNVTVNSDGSQYLGVGDQIYVKIVGYGTETLKPVSVSLQLDYNI